MQTQGIHTNTGITFLHLLCGFWTPSGEEGRTDLFFFHHIDVGQCMPKVTVQTLFHMNSKSKRSFDKIDRKCAFMKIRRKKKVTLDNGR